MSRGNRYANAGSKREELKDKKPASGSGLPTPEPETKKLPDTETIPRVNTLAISMPPGQTTRAGKAPERSPIPDITPTPDMKSIGAILHTIKQNVAKLEGTLEGIGKQAAALTALHAPLKIQEEYRTVQEQLQQQIERQKEEIKRKRVELEGLLLRQLDERIRRRIDDEVHEIVKRTVADRIKTELDRLIPEELKRQSWEHRERALRIRSDLINNEARRRNANVSEGTGRLHPLVMGRPTTVSRTSSRSTASPSTAGGILQTPLDNSLLFSHVRNHSIDEGYPSPVFPEVKQDLFHRYLKDKGKIRQLLEDYEGPENLINLTDDLQVVDAIDWLGHNFGVLGPSEHFILPPVKPVKGQPLSPLIMSAD